MFERIRQFKQLMTLMQNARQHADQLRDRCARETVVGTAGGDMVRVTVNLLGEVQRIEIDPVLRESPDWDVLTDLLRVAINDAFARISERMLEVMGDSPMGQDASGPLGAALSELLGGSGLASMFGGAAAASSSTESTEPPAAPESPQEPDRTETP